MDEGAPHSPEGQDPLVNDTMPQPGQHHVPTSPTADHDGIASTYSTRPLSTITERQLPRLPPEVHAVRPHSRSDHFERMPSPRHVRNGDILVRMPSARQTLVSPIGLPTAPPNASGIDWIVPVNEKPDTRRTVGERLQPTIDNASVERDKCARKAVLTGYALNIAIGLQVLLGAMTTGIAAAATTAQQASFARISTCMLGGLATLVASYLARARGSGEPELSITRVKDLEHFLRETRTFQLDHAHEYPTPENRLGERLEDFRHRFEELLGNASGERKLSPVGITHTPVP